MNSTDPLGLFINGRPAPPPPPTTVVSGILSIPYNFATDQQLYEQYYGRQFDSDPGPPRLRRCAPPFNCPPPANNATAPNSQEACVQNFYSTTAGKATKIASVGTLIPGWTGQSYFKGLLEWVGAPLLKVGLARAGQGVSAAIGSTEFASVVSGSTLRMAGPAEAFLPTLGRAATKAAPWVVAGATLTDMAIHQACFDMANPDSIPPVP